MGLFWHFITSLTPEELSARRAVLDWYGLAAQASLLIPLISRIIYAWLLHFTRSTTRRAPDIPTSPQLKRRRELRSQSGVHALITKARYWDWLLDSPLVPSLPSIGTRREWLAGTAWFLWLFTLCAVQTGDDYMHLTRRFGLIAGSQLPFHYLLTVRSVHAPLQALCRLSHEELNTIHQVLGRIIVLFALLHAGFYLNFFVFLGVLAEKLTHPVVILGITAASSFAVLGATSLAQVRKLNYRFFYATHIVIGTVILPILYFHVHHIRIYIWETLAIYMLKQVQRYWNTSTVDATISLVPGTNLLRIAFPTATPRGRKWKWTAGEHVYLSIPPSQHPSKRENGAPGMAMLQDAVVNHIRTNPLTIASLPADGTRPDGGSPSGGKIELVARTLSGTTKRWQDIASRSPREELRLKVEGPYGAARYLPPLSSSSDRILFVAGGIGATYILPLYRQTLRELERDARQDMHSTGNGRVSCVWMVRSSEETSWVDVGEGDEESEKGFYSNLHLYITRQRGHDPLPSRPSISNAAALGEEEIEMEERAGLLASDPLDPTDAEEDAEVDVRNNENNEANADDKDRLAADDKSKQATKSKSPYKHTYTHRPQISEILSHAFGADHERNSLDMTEGLTVVFCGPPALGELLRKELGEQVRRGRVVRWSREGFGNTE